MQNFNFATTMVLFILGNWTLICFISMESSGYLQLRSNSKIYGTEQYSVLSDLFIEPNWMPLVKIFVRRTPMPWGTTPSCSASRNRCGPCRRRGTGACPGVEIYELRSCQELGQLADLASYWSLTLVQPIRSQLACWHNSWQWLQFINFHPW